MLSEGAALLSATGDTDFNAYIRSCATKQDLTLNEYGLWRFCSGKTPSTTESNASPSPLPADSKCKKSGRWELVASSTETEVLEALGVGFVEPERRNFSFIVQRSKSESSAVLKAYIPPEPRLNVRRAKKN